MRLRSEKMKKRIDSSVEGFNQKRNDPFMARIIIKTYGAILLTVWLIPVYYVLETLASEYESHWYARGAFYGAWLVCISFSALALTLPQSFFELRPFEKCGSVYEQLGVKKFKWVVNNGDGMRTIFRFFFPGAIEPNNSRSMQQWLKQGITNERVHWSSLFGTAPAALWAAYSGRELFTLYFILANIPANIYPIILQRFTRARLLEIFKKRPAALGFQPSSLEAGHHGMSLEKILSSPSVNEPRPGNP